MGKELYQPINIYEHTEEEKQVETQGSLSGLVTGGDLVDTKKRVRKRPFRLSSGAQYGLLELNKQVKKHSSSGMKYQCKCKCGRKVMLTRLKILERDRLNIGCLDGRCPLGSEELRAWHDPEFALQLQLTALLKADPGSVDNSWGGSAYEGMDPVASSEGREAMWHDLRPLIRKTGYRWWMQRKNWVLPYSLFNVELTDTPSFEAIGGMRNYVMHKGMLRSLIELAVMFDVPLVDIRHWRTNPSDKLVMKRIIEESST